MIKKLRFRLPRLPRWIFPWRILKTLTGRVLWVALGLMLGLFLFMPWEVVWSSLLSKADSKLSAVEIQWRDVPDAHINSVRIAGLQLTTPFARVSLPECSLRLGLSPLVKVGIVSGGQQLQISLDSDKRIALQGAIDPGEIVEGHKVEGVVEVNGAFLFPDWKTPRPDKGTLELAASRLLALGSIEAEGVLIRTELEGDTLRINSFSLQKPFPIEGKGSVVLNFSDLLSSTYQIEGTIRLGDIVQPFTREGSLRQAAGGM